MTRSRIRLGRCVLFAALGVASPSFATNPPNARVEVRRALGTEICLDEDRLVAMIERRLRRRVFDETRNAELELLVEFRKTDGWNARVALADSKGLLGTRELSTRARHCSALDDSLALVIALLVDTPPKRPEPELEPEGAVRSTLKPNATASPRQVTPFTPITLPEDTYASREPSRFDLSVSASVLAFVLPSLTPGIECRVGLKLPRGPWLRFTGELYPTAEKSLAGSSNGAQFSLVRAGFELCGWTASSFGVVAELCAGQRVGQLRASGVGFDLNQETSRLYYSLVAGGNALVPLGSMGGLVAGLHLEVPFTRDEFTARQNAPENIRIFKASPVGGIAAVGFRLEL